MISSLVISPEYPNWDEKIKPQWDTRILDNGWMRKELLRQILAANVSRRMKAAGLKQPDVAQKAGIGQSHVSRILGAKQSIGLDIVAAVSGVLGCQPWELLIDNDAIRREAIERALGPAPVPSFIPPPEKRVAHQRKSKK